MSWSDQDIKLAIDLWKKGFSASQTAKILNDQTGRCVSRNAVTGLLWRLGYRHARGKDAITVGRPSVRGRKQGPLSTRIRIRSDEPQPFLRPETGKPYTILTIKNGCCRWMRGDGPEAPMCGHPVQPGSPYCLHHTMRAWQPRQKGTRTLKPHGAFGRIRFSMEAA